MYPDKNPEFKYAGIFVKEQVDALNDQKDIDCKYFIIDGFKSKLTYLFSAIHLYLHLMLNKYDVIHVHYGLSGLFTFVNPFKKYWPNVVLTLHGGDILTEQGKTVQVYLTKKIVKRVGTVITLNETMNKVVSSIRPDFQVLPCGIDADYFQASYLDKRENVIIFPGNRARSVKNFTYFELVIKAYRAKYGDVETVELDGFNREEVKAVMATSKAMLMTSISEGSPQAVKEALSSDLVVVSSDVGDVSQVLGHTSGTRIFNLSESPEKVADLLYQAICEASEGANDRRARILDLGLDNKTVVSRLIELYRSITSNV
jgi:glycosyltransferase involved in cell wall biosynthesis